ncbi:MULTISPECIES: hypothetical protein [unclassified Chryseobacterium]|uniref:hypothetical protein n=1 Tax=unclassified Chryseobacterium TaxID=2593645 RepID=UPI003018555D
MEKLKLKIEKQNKTYAFKTAEQKVRILETVAKVSDDFKSLKDNFKEIITLLHSS